MRRLLAALAPPAAALALASPAHAGTYDVHFCNAGATVLDNRSWSALASPGIVTDSACATAGTLIGIRVDAGRRSAAGAVAGLAAGFPYETGVSRTVGVRVR